MTGKPSVAGKRMARLRRSAYAVVDQRSGGQCEMWDFSFQTPRCPQRLEQHHHRRPRRSGGSTDPVTERASNVVGLCWRHHDWVERYRTAVVSLGLLVQAGHDPSTTSVLLHCGRVLLDDEGGWTPTEGET